MNIDHLSEFIYVAETLSFSAAAKRFYVSQSVLSKHIAAMEDELCTKLFVRDSHHVRLTRSGEAFLEEATAIVNDYERALARIAAINQSFETVVRVGYLRNACRPFLAMFLKRMKKERPEVRVNPTCMEYGELFSALDRKKIDVAFAIDLNSEIRKRCDAFPIYEDRFDAVVSCGHDLAAFAPQGITSDLLCDRQLLLPELASYPGMSDFVEGFLPDGCCGIRQYYNDVDTMFLDVEMGECVAFSSEHNIPVFGDRVCFLPINDRPSSYNVSALWLKDSREAVSPCLDALAHCRERLLAKRVRQDDGGHADSKTPPAPAGGKPT